MSVIKTQQPRHLGPVRQNAKVLSLYSYRYPGELAKLYFGMTGLGRQLTHLPVPSLMGLSSQSQINSVTALAPGLNKNVFSISNVRRPNIKCSLN